MGAAFIVFALTSAFLLPRSRPNFPGGGLRWFVLASTAFFAAMIAAVVIFGVESESKAEAGETTAESQPTNTSTESSPGAAAKKVDVSLVDFKIRLPSGTTLEPGKYDFAVSNDGQVPHNLTIDGPGVEDAGTPTFGPGKTDDLKVTLEAGSYDFYCSVPGHKALGMDVKVTVSA